MYLNVAGVDGALSRIKEKESPENKNTELIQCFPFYSILLATGRTRVDLFSLDIEGDELAVLKTIPWNKVDIKVVIVEYNFKQDIKKALVDYMSSKGYINLPELHNAGWQDVVFVKNSLEYNRTFITGLLKNRKAL